MLFWETIPVLHHIFNNLTNEEKLFLFNSSADDLKVQRWKKNINNICEIGNKNEFKRIILLELILGIGSK